MEATRFTKTSASFSIFGSTGATRRSILTMDRRRCCSCSPSRRSANSAIERCEIGVRMSPPAVPVPGRRIRRLLSVALLALAPCVGHAAGSAGKPDTQASDSLPGTRIAAVVNGDVISNGDVDNRARLFAMSTGLPLSGDVVDRLKPQITRQLVDERLRIQEAQRRKVVISDQQIAGAMHDIEQ